MSGEASDGTVLGIVIGVAGQGSDVRLRIGRWVADSAEAAPPTDPSLRELLNQKPERLARYSLREVVQVGDFPEDAARALARYPDLLVGRIIEMGGRGDPRLIRVRTDVDPYDPALIEPR